MQGRKVAILSVDVLLFLLDLLWLWQINILTLRAMCVDQLWFFGIAWIGVDDTGADCSALRWVNGLYFTLDHGLEKAPRYVFECKRFSISLELGIAGVTLINILEERRMLGLALDTHPLERPGLVDAPSSA